ncbi:PIN-like domain-containing protein [Fusobacterium sp.]|uniref:PIN-like domain-containing protein n=1 Tax=Fusobacterium sp. TaxID=68766 RepID=UPI0028FE7251|nr:PIN-like domain-containing protein [Fusobacterium sp.]MDU1912588.1 PIN-like domain-containing protein [Fusobacterium sp.]
MKKKYENLVNTFKNVERYSDEISDEHFKTSKIVFDTNILLDIYLYPEKDRKKIFNLLKRIEIKERLFMPYQVLFEFSKNRNKMIKKLEKYKNGIGCEDNKNGEVIDKIIKFSQEGISKTEKITWNRIDLLGRDNLDCLNKNENIVKKLDTCFESYKEKIKVIHKEVEEEIKDIFKGVEKEDISLENDPILKELFKIFENKIGEECTAENYISIQMEGLKRITRNVPFPGSEDLKTKKDNEFGDFFIWKEIKSINDNVIFVSEEKKEDWIEKTIPNTLKIALKEEHKEATSKEIYLIRFKDFIDKASEIYEIPEKDRIEVSDFPEQPVYISKAGAVIMSSFNHLSHEGKSKYLKILDKTIKGEPLLKNELDFIRFTILEFHIIMFTELSKDEQLCIVNVLKNIEEKIGLPLGDDIF